MPPSPLPYSVSLLGAGGVAFLTLGVLQAVYGPAFLLFESKFGVSTAAVGLIATAHFLGSASAPLLVAALLERSGLVRIVTGALTLLALGAGLVALAASWPLALLGAVVGGLGLGGVSAALNTAYARIGTRAVNFINALFGVGSMLAPLLLTLGERLTAQHAALPFAFGTIVVLALLSLLVSLLVLGTQGLPRTYYTVGDREPQQERKYLSLFAAVLLLYVGVEVGTGAWAAKVLGAYGHARPELIVSGYWGGLTVSRVLVSLFGSRLRPERLVLTSALAVTLASALTLLPAVAPAAYLLVGLACGPIFATTLAWAVQWVPARTMPLMLTAGSAGGVLMPWLLGQAFGHYGAGAVPLLLTLTGAGLCALVAVTLRGTPSPPDR